MSQPAFDYQLNRHGDDLEGTIITGVGEEGGYPTIYLSNGTEIRIQDVYATVLVDSAGVPLEGER